MIWEFGCSFRKKQGLHSGVVMAEALKWTPPEGSWKCESCGNVNFPKRSVDRFANCDVATRVCKGAVCTTMVWLYSRQIPTPQPPVGRCHGGRHQVLRRGGGVFLLRFCFSGQYATVAASQAVVLQRSQSFTAPQHPLSAQLRPLVLQLGRNGFHQRARGLAQAVKILTFQSGMHKNMCQMS